MYSYSRECNRTQLLAINVLVLLVMKMYSAPGVNVIQQSCLSCRMVTDAAQKFTLVSMAFRCQALTHSSRIVHHRMTHRDM